MFNAKKRRIKELAELLGTATDKLAANDMELSALKFQQMQDEELLAEQNELIEDQGYALETLDYQLTVLESVLKQLNVNVRLSKRKAAK